MARTDTLGNFLTDVAEAIRTKEGTTEPIAASEFDTRISNLSSEGGISNEPITHLNELGEAIASMVAAQLNAIVDNYPVYTTDKVTLYTPSADATHYVIRYRSSGYSIVWYTCQSIFVSDYLKPSTTTIGSFTIINGVPTPTVTNTTLSKLGYMSPNYTTFEGCVAALQDPNTVYTESTSLDWSNAADGEFNLSATNMTITNQAGTIKTRRISSNEIIEVIGE